MSVSHNDFFFTFAFTSRWVKSLENLQMHFLQDSDLTNFCPIWIFHISVHDAFEGTITILFSLLWHSFHNFESWKKFVLVFFVVASRGHSKWVWSPQMNSAENYMTFFMVAKNEIFSNQWRRHCPVILNESYICWRNSQKKLNPDESNRVTINLAIFGKFWFSIW